MCWSEALRGCQPSIKPEYSLEGPMLKLKFQYMGHLMRRANDSLEKTLMLGKTEGRRRRGWQRMRWLDDITDLVDKSLSKGQGSLACCSPWGHKESNFVDSNNWATAAAARVTPMEPSLCLSWCCPGRVQPWQQIYEETKQQADVLILRCEVLVTVPTIPIPGGHVKEKLTPGGTTKKHTP